MKRPLCVLLLLLSLFLPAFAESVDVPMSEDDIIAWLETQLSPSYDYLKIWYYQPSNCICIDVASNGLAGIVSAYLEQGYDDTFTPWVNYRNGQMVLYNVILDVFRQVGREDMSLSFSIVNDDIYIRNDDSRLSATTILSIRDGEVWFDLLYERSMLKKLFGER